VYGRRDGAITGLAVVHRDRGNLFPPTKGFRVGVVHDVAMLPRAMMYKPPHASCRISCMLIRIHIIQLFIIVVSYFLEKCFFQH